MKHKTISELYIEVDKMSGLRLRGESKTGIHEVISIKGWDDKRDMDVRGILDGKGIQLLTQGFMDTEFAQFDEVGKPIPYAQRSGSLGKPKTIGFIRLGTIDGLNFALNLCDRNGEIISNLHEGDLDSNKELHIKTEYTTKTFMIFDKELHAKKINKILSNNSN